MYIFLFAAELGTWRLSFVGHCCKRFRTWNKWQRCTKTVWNTPVPVYKECPYCESLYGKCSPGVVFCYSPTQRLQHCPTEILLSSATALFNATTFFVTSSGGCRLSWVQPSGHAMMHGYAYPSSSFVNEGLCLLGCDVHTPEGTASIVYIIPQGEWRAWGGGIVIYIKINAICLAHLDVHIVGRAAHSFFAYSQTFNGINKNFGGKNIFFFIKQKCPVAM